MRSSPQRIAEADAFYADLQRQLRTTRTRRVQRQAFAGMLWSKQFYHYDVPHGWTAIRASRRRRQRASHGRNNDWPHFDIADVVVDAGQMGVSLVRRLGLGLSLRDAWRWSIPSSPSISSILLCASWYMHPNGQIAGL